ncbi:unnamed protein product [Phaeothamnion confervicola]
MWWGAGAAATYSAAAASMLPTAGPERLQHDRHVDAMATFAPGGILAECHQTGEDNSGEWHEKVANGDVVAVNDARQRPAAQNGDGATTASYRHIIPYGGTML